MPHDVASTLSLDSDGTWLGAGGGVGRAQTTLGSRGSRRTRSVVLNETAAREHREGKPSRHEHEAANAFGLMQHAGQQ